MLEGKILETRIMHRSYSKVATELTVYSGLHYIKGNRAPHFTITSWEHRKGNPEQMQSGGANHAAILKLFPKYADLVALHLCDMDGSPMHAVENGWYWMGKTQYQTRDNAALAKHLRIPEAEAAALNFETKDQFAAYVDSLRPRWKQEADAAIAKYNLPIFGDTWQ